MSTHRTGRSPEHATGDLFRLAFPSKSFRARDAALDFSDRAWFDQSSQMRVYLDVCCLNRPFDDQSQERIRLESEAVLLVFFRVGIGALEWVASDVVDHEVSLTPDITRRSRVGALLSGATERMTLDDDDEKRAVELRALGFHALDALHLACAERAGVDVFLTTDDRLLKTAARSATDLRITVDNPLRWILKEPSQ